MSTEHTPSSYEWVVVATARNRFMVIEENGTEDGRLVADNILRSDAEHIAWLHNAGRAAIDKATGAAA